MTNFIKKLKTEWSKIRFPHKERVYHETVAVAATGIIIGAFIGVLDTAFRSLAGLIF